LRRTATVVLMVALGQVACGRAPADSARTPLPTQQSTIDPVKQKLDAAAKDVERQRQSIDDSAK
jgi:hypothetical protein